MKKGLILYQSKYGSAKKYANWLQEMTSFDCLEVKKAPSGSLNLYETIILCGAIYASGISGISYLKKNIQQLKAEHHKKIAIFCVGASPYDEKALQEIRQLNLKGDLEDLPLFYGRGAWDEEAMTFKDRTLCRLLQKSVAKKDPATYEPWMKALMCAVGQKCDWTDRKYLDPLIVYLDL